MFDLPNVHGPDISNILAISIKLVHPSNEGNYVRVTKYLATQGKKVKITIKVTKYVNSIEKEILPFASNDRLFCVENLKNSSVKFTSRSACCSKTSCKITYERKRELAGYVQKYSS